MEQLPVEKFHGVGKVTAAKMKAMSIHTGADLKTLSKENTAGPFWQTPEIFITRL